MNKIFKTGPDDDTIMLNETLEEDEAVIDGTTSISLSNTTMRRKGSLFVKKLM